MNAAPSVTPLLKWGVAAAPKPGESRCGDLHAVIPYPAGTVVAVFDGLGHGAEAEAAALAGAEILRTRAGDSALLLTRRCHQHLQGTRGAVMGLAVFSSVDHTLTWLGIGNVEGILLRAASHPGPGREVLIPRGGVLGYQLPPLSASVMALGRGDRLIFYTDGICDGFAERTASDELPDAAAARILATAAKGTDDALVLVADYAGDPP